MQQLSDLILGHETERAEFKEIWQDDAVLRTLGAFANTRGGILLIGVTDKKQVIGWTGISAQLQALTSKIVTSLRTQPASMPIVNPTHEDDIAHLQTVNRLAPAGPITPILNGAWHE